MIKVVFFDVDGTLVSHDTESVPNSTRKAIQLLQDNNIKVVIATGRHMHELYDLPCSDICFDAYITLNGQICLGQDKQVLFTNELNDVEIIKKLFNEKKMPMQILELNDMYLNYINDYVIEALNAVSIPIMGVKPLTNHKIYQAIAYVKEDKTKYLENLLPNCTITRWNSKAVDIISKGSGKVEGIKKYLELNNIKQEETMAFGDGENDIGMLKYVNIGIAMGNAEDNVKANADYITSHIDEDGIYDAVMKFIEF